MQRRLKCPECGDGYLVLIEPGVRTHTNLEMRDGVLVVTQTYPIEFDADDSGGETICCNKCDYTDSPSEISWR